MPPLLGEHGTPIATPVHHPGRGLCGRPDQTQAPEHKLEMERVRSMFRHHHTPGPSTAAPGLPKPDAAPRAPSSLTQLFEALSTAGEADPTFEASNPGFSPPRGEGSLIEADFGDTAGTGITTVRTRPAASPAPRGVVVKGVTVGGKAPEAIVDPNRKKLSLQERARMLAQAEEARDIVAGGSPPSTGQPATG